MKPDPQRHHLGAHLDHPPGSAARISDRHEAYALCLYCPSLCRHACPVATARGDDTRSPWGLMSLASHLEAGRVAPDASIAEALTGCVNCGACSAACAYDNPVGEALVQARAWLHEAGFPAPVPDHAAAGGSGTTAYLPLAARSDAPDGAAIASDAPVIEALRARSRYEPSPAFSFVPGISALSRTGGPVEQFFALCQRLDVEALSCGDLARFDSGHDLWWSGQFRAFVEHARRVHAATIGARDIVVMSAQTLYLFKVIYPRFGLRIHADIVHLSEFLLPLLTGAVVSRIPGRVMYHESCHLGRHLGLRDVPREVLRRVLENALVEVPACADLTGCCGGSAAPTFGPETSEAMADALVEAALEARVDRLVSFSSECVRALEAAALRRHPEGSGTSGLRICHAVELVAEAVVGDGAAA
jgi:fumarate reductase (CoM/CoB) subunit B